MTKNDNLAYQFSELQQKYIYYLIGICIASIGFVVVNTQDSSLNIYQIPLGGSVLCWALSILFGLLAIKLGIKGISQNYMFLNAYKKFPDKSDQLKEVMDSIHESNDKKMGFYLSMQIILFFVGVGLYLTWHIMEMYFRCSC